MKISIITKPIMISFHDTFLKYSNDDTKREIIDLILKFKRENPINYFSNSHDSANNRYDALQIVKGLKDKLGIGLKEAKDLWEKLNVNL